MARCAPSLRYLKSYKETVKLGKAVYTAPKDSVPTDVPEELVQAILSARATRVMKAHAARPYTLLITIPLGITTTPLSVTVNR